MGEQYPPTDPRALKLAAGESGGQYGFMQVGMSDKAAKDVSETFKSIESTSKIGAWGVILQLVTTFIDLSNNPLVKVFIEFFKYMTTRINAEFADAAARLAETLFSERSIEQMDKMANVFGFAAKGIEVLIEQFDRYDKALTTISDGRIDGFSGALDYLGIIIAAQVQATKDFYNGVGDLRDAIDDILSPLDEFKDLIEEIKELIE